VLLEPVITPALRVAVAHAGTSACFVRGVVLEVALGGGPATPRSGAGRVPDLGQMPQPAPGIMTPGLEPVIAVLRGDRIEADQQVRPAPGDAQPPSPSSGVNANPGPSRVPGPARFRWRLGSGRAQPWPTACPCPSVTVTHHVVAGLRAAAAARSRASQGSMGPIPGISPGRSASPAAVVSGTV